MTGARSIDSRDGKQIRFQAWPRPVAVKDVISAKELAGQSLLSTGLPRLRHILGQGSPWSKLGVIAPGRHVASEACPLKDCMMSWPTITVTERITRLGRVPRPRFFAPNSPEARKTIFNPGSGVSSHESRQTHSMRTLLRTQVAVPARNAETVAGAGVFLCVYGPVSANVAARARRELRETCRHNICNSDSRSAS
jgi:hypothetical protein